MNPNEIQSYFNEAINDPTLWDGYVRWLNEQADISDFELWHEKHEFQG